MDSSTYGMCLHWQWLRRTDLIRCKFNTQLKRDVKKRHAVRRVSVSGVVQRFVVLKVFFVFKSNLYHNSRNGLFICHRILVLKY